MIINKIWRVAKKKLRKQQQILLFSHSRLISKKWDVKNDMLHKQYCDFVQQHGGTRYYAEISSIPNVNVKHKWVGAQIVKNNAYAIPNDSESILRCTGQKNILCGVVGSDLFKWTGGCVWNGKLYAFPRKNSSFLEFDMDTEVARELPLSFKYSKEHHYGGVCIADGIVYQPPRSTDHILATNLTTGCSWKVQISPKLWNMKLRYCGSILHPNGCAYFFPEHDGKVIKLDIKEEKWCFIGDIISTMTFDAKVATDGNIYGFSAYEKGILKIDVSNDTVEMIHKEIDAGAYGTKLGINGKLYSVPGNGNKILEYDVLRDTIVCVHDLMDSNFAKYAGGATDRMGNIYFVPATENKVILLQAEESVEIPEMVYQNYFVDCY